MVVCPRLVSESVAGWVSVVSRESVVSRDPEIVWAEVYSAAFSINNNATVTGAKMLAIGHTIDVLPR
eukprot:4018214-Pyramimonas_sp.AAC.1